MPRMSPYFVKPKKIGRVIQISRGRPTPPVKERDRRIAERDQRRKLAGAKKKNDKASLHKGESSVWPLQQIAKPIDEINRLLQELQNDDA